VLFHEDVFPYSDLQNQVSKSHNVSPLELVILGHPPTLPLYESSKAGSGSIGPTSTLSHASPYPSLGPMVIPLPSMPHVSESEPDFSGSLQHFTQKADQSSSLESILYPPVSTPVPSSSSPSTLSSCALSSSPIPSAHYTLSHSSSFSIAIIPCHPFQTKSRFGIVKPHNIFSLHSQFDVSESTSYTQASKDAKWRLAMTRGDQNWLTGKSVHKKMNRKHN